MIIGVSFLVSTLCKGTDIVYDPINHGTSIVQEITNLSHWVPTELHAAATELNTLNTYEQEVLQVLREGDPRSLVANIPGVQNLQTLSAIYSQGLKDINDWAAFANPKSWTMTGQQILNIYGQPGFNGFTAANGVHIGAAQSLVQFQISNFNTDKSAQQTVTRLTAQLKTETDELAAATKSMQAATDQSTVQKYQASISALHGAITATNAALQMAKFSEQLQTQQNHAAQAISQATTLQQQAAQAYQAIDQDLSNLPVQGFRQNILWGQP